MRWHKLGFQEACNMGADKPWKAETCTLRSSKDYCDIWTVGETQYSIAVYVPRPLAAYIVALHNDSLANEPKCCECGGLLDQESTAHASNGNRNWCKKHNYSNQIAEISGRGGWYRAVREAEDKA